MCNRHQRNGSHGRRDKSPRTLVDGSVIENLQGEYRKTLPDGTVIRRILGNCETTYPDGTRVVEWTTGAVWTYDASGQAVSVKHPDGELEKLV